MNYWNSNRSEIDTIIEQAYGMHNKVCTELALEMFWDALGGYSIPDIRQAFIEYSKISVHCPKPADILKLLKEKKAKVAAAMNLTLRAKIDAAASTYEDVYTKALQAGNWEEMKRLRTLMAAEYISNLNKPAHEVR